MDKMLLLNRVEMAARVAILKSASLASGDRTEHLQQGLNSLGYSWSTSEVSSRVSGEQRQAGSKARFGC